MGVVFLRRLIESSRLNLSEIDFADSLLVLAYSDEVNDVLRNVSLY
jgi:hypothetical protein